MAVKSKKETKVTKKEVEDPATAGTKRKTVTFSEKETVETKPAKKKTKKVVEKKVVAEPKEVEKEEEEEETLDDVEDLTEEQEEALRKEILGDLQSSDEDDSSDDDEDALGKNESMVALDEKKLEKSKEETKKAFDKKSKSSAKASKQEDDDEEERGVIYLGHIPHGFYEDEMHGYFTQFGNITRLRLSRSKKTGNSRHYAFIEFESADVARIVAETMNNYLLFEKMLKCVVIPPEQVRSNLFAGANKKYKHFNWTAHNRKLINKPKNAQQLKAHQKKLTKNYGKKQKALKDAGFDYELPPLN